MNPQTLAGKLLRAIVLRDAQGMEGPRIALEKSGWIDASRVFDDAFAAVVRLRFAEVTDVRLISRWIIAVAAQRNIRAKLPIAEAEAMIRHAMGEDVDISDIPGLTRPTIKLVITEAAILDLGWTENDIDSFLVEVEQRVRSRGFQPTVG